MRRDPKTLTYDFIARAKEAKLRVDLDKKLIWVHMYECSMVNENGSDTGSFTEKAWPVELPPELLTAEKARPADMTWPELDEFRQRYLEQKAKADALSRVRRARDQHVRPPEQVRSPADAALQESRMYERHLANIDVEIHMRLALATGCLCFVLVGCPVGIWFSKSDYLSAFITCFLPIIVVYYPLMLGGINLAKDRQLPPAVALWAANGVMLVTAFLLFRRLARN
jgi:lipopolysaccharide export system permease protein